MKKIIVMYVSLIFLSMLYEMFGAFGKMVLLFILLFEGVN